MFSFRKKVAPICVTAVAACALALAGCSSGDGLTGGVAATVNGTEIAEDDVTVYIENMRTGQSVTSDRDWANWLNNNGYTPSTIREAVINMFVVQELEKADAEAHDIEVTDEEVDAVIESMKSNYDTDEAWQSALESAGLTEDTYRENVYYPMLEEKLLEVALEDGDDVADDETVLTYVQMYAPSLDGMKRSSHILFSADDEATAQQVLDQLNAGADFAEMAREYSTDSSAENGGDVGWNGLTSFVTAYSDALDELDEGQVSGLVTSEYGIHIIKCTEVWNAPETIESLDQVPSEVVEIIRTQMADPAAEQMAYSNYLQKLQDDADIVINEMPANVPYNVDMEKYISSSSAEDSSAATDEAAAEDSESEASESSSASEADEASESSSSSEADEDAGSSSSSADSGDSESTGSSAGESSSSSSSSGK